MSAKSPKALAMRCVCLAFCTRIAVWCTRQQNPPQKQITLPPPTPTPTPRFNYNRLFCSCYYEPGSLHRPFHSTPLPLTLCRWAFGGNLGNAFSTDWQRNASVNTIPLWYSQRWHSSSFEGAPPYLVRPALCPTGLNVGRERPRSTREIRIWSYVPVLLHVLRAPCAEIEQKSQRLTMSNVLVVKATTVQS